MTAAAVMIRREKEMVAVFRAAHATSPDTARPPDALGLTSEHTIRRLEARAVLRPGTQPGTPYLDEPSWAAIRGIRRRMLIVVLIVVLFGLAAAVLTTRQAGR
jgi:hypothetical protein